MNQPQSARELPGGKYQTFSHMRESLVLGGRLSMKDYDEDALFRKRLFPEARHLRRCNGTYGAGGQGFGRLTA